MTDTTFDPYDPALYTTVQQVGNGEVQINGKRFPVLNGQVNELQLARFQNKVTFGDYGLDSDPLLSSQILSNFGGGMGNETLKEGVDDDTFWDATLETRYPDGPTLLPLSTAHGDPAGTATSASILGDFPASDLTFVVAFDQRIHTWDEANQVFVDTTNTLTAIPVERGVEFEGDLYVPLGGSGFDVVSLPGHTVANATTFDPLQFMVWDRKLMALDTDGLLWRKNPGGSAWAEASAVPEDVTVPSGDRPRKLVMFYTQNNIPTVHVVTDQSVYAYDPDGEVLYQTHLNFPKHPYQGLAAANWRGDSLFVSVGTGIHSYNGTNITSMGPDGRHGLPARLRGYVVDLVPEYNALLAYVRGTANPNAEDEEERYLSTPPLYRDRHTYDIADYQYRPVYSSILRWSNSQWHKVWESDDASGTPGFMYISQADNAYRLWWSYGNQVYTQKLQVAFQNPKQALRIGIDEFEPDGFLITGWFDADMTAFTKLAAQVAINLEDVTESDDPGGSVTVQYQHNDDLTWKTLGTASTVGKTIMPFQNELHESGIYFSRGLPFRRIRFRLQFNQASGETTKSPLMSSLVFNFIKIPESQLSWSFTVPLNTQEGYKNNGNKALARELNTALYSEEFIEFVLDKKVFRTRIAQTAGNRFTGFDERGDYQVNLVEVTLGSLRDDAVLVNEDLKVS